VLRDTDWRAWFRAEQEIRMALSHSGGASDIAIGETDEMLRSLRRADLRLQVVAGFPLEVVGLLQTRRRDDVLDQREALTRPAGET
jgi:hypothetical protein